MCLLKSAVKQSIVLKIMAIDQSIVFKIINFYPLAVKLIKLNTRAIRHFARKIEKVPASSNKR